MRFFTKNTKGETLAETVVALSILAIGITVASTIISSSVQNMENAYNRILAVNFAREGIEGVENIRETNWMKFSSDKRGCWNHLPENWSHNPDGSINDTSDVCPPSTNLISPGTYIVYLDTDMRWRLMQIDNLIDNDVKESLPKLYRLSGATGIQEIINHNVTLGFSTPNNLGGNPDLTLPDVITPFKRIITLKYIKDDGTAATTDPTKENRMEITSTVTWSRYGQDFKVELKMRLSDYLGRTNLTE